MVRSLLRLDLEKNAKDQLEGQSNKRTRKSKQIKMHIDYSLAMKT